MCYDPQIIEVYVHRSGGHSLRQSQQQFYWVPSSAETLLILVWPDLKRLPLEDR